MITFKFCMLLQASRLPSQNAKNGQLRCFENQAMC